MQDASSVKKRIIISLFAIILLALTLFGITYAFFVARVHTNLDTNQINANAALLKLDYNGEDSYVKVEALIPGEKIENKVFSVINTGTAPINNYDVILENVVNELSMYEDLEYNLVCVSSDGKACNNSTGIFPKTNQVIGTNTIDPGVTHSYTLTLNYKETNKNQSIDMNKEISAKVNIKDDYSDFKTLKIYGNSQTIVDSPMIIKNLGNKDEVDNSYNIPIHVVTGKNIANPKMVELFVENVKNTLKDGSGFNKNAEITIDHNRPLLSIDSQLGYNKFSENPSMHYEKLRKIFTGIFKENTQYTISFNYYLKELGQPLNLALYYKDSQYVQGTNLLKNSQCDAEELLNKKCLVSFTTDEGKSVDSIKHYYNKGFTYIYLDTLQIEEGNTKTDYEPYKGSVVNLILDEPLRKIGDATDYVDIENRIIVRNVGEIIFDGTENILRDENGVLYYELPHNLNIPVISNYDINDTSYEYYVTSTLDSNAIYFNTDMTTEEFKAYLVERYNEGKPLTVQYALDKSEFKKVEIPGILLEESNNLYVCDDSLLCSSKIEVEFDK